jgi:ornithine decarboxylase
VQRLSVRPHAAGQWYRELRDRSRAPLLILDPRVLVEQYERLQRALPGVRLHYAIKSLPHPVAVQTLAAVGASFDVATSGELRMLEELGVPPGRTIHTHPIKRPQDIERAIRFGCRSFVVDNACEIRKCAPFREHIELLLRLSFPNPDSPVDLSRKFGCAPEEAEGLLELAQRCGLRVQGLSFHAGSQSPSACNHVKGIQCCLALADAHERATGRALPVLDIGGGFPVEYVGETAAIDSFCKPIREALAQAPPTRTIIAEPGRYLSGPAMLSISRVMGVARRGGTTWYYLDDGVYGSYSGQIFDHAVYPLSVFSDRPEREPAVLAGPTCDSVDVIAERIALPPLEPGDVVVGHQMGAYTAASATDFNLFDRARILVARIPGAARSEVRAVPGHARRISRSAWAKRRDAASFAPLGHDALDGLP